jgi:HTH-type transcriptional regulator/antitoxin HigA
MNVKRAGPYPYAPDVVLSPGDHLAEVLEDQGMSQADLAKRTGLSAKHVSQIINAGASISIDTALLLEKATMVPARTWSAIEAAYREHLSRLQEEEVLAGEVGWLEALPIGELKNRGCLATGRTPVDQLRKVYEFFGVANHHAWEAVWLKPTAYRKSKAFSSDPGAVAAWLRIGELEAAEVRTQPFNRQMLVQTLNEVRTLTCDPDPRSWWPKLRELCSSVGVVVVAEPEIKGARINGAARWLGPDRALLQLSLRHKWSDIFWFTFFHEAGHLLLHSKKQAFINDVGEHSGVEQEADAFASQTLIPERYVAELADLTSLDDVIDFSVRVGVAPGIVVGRLQHEGRWPYGQGNTLKQRLAFTSS